MTCCRIPTYSAYSRLLLEKNQEALFIRGSLKPGRAALEALAAQPWRDVYRVLGILESAACTLLVRVSCVNPSETSTPLRCIQCSWRCVQAGRPQGGHARRGRLCQGTVLYCIASSATLLALPAKTCIHTLKQPHAFAPARSCD